jgi:hypothetical protein
MSKAQKATFHNTTLVSSLLALSLYAACLLPSTSFGQQPQAQGGQPVFAANAKYVQGVGPGYWPTAATGLALNVAAGTAYCGDPPALVTYAGGSLTLTANATNYVYLDPGANCAPTASTTGFTAGRIPLAKVITGASTITSITDARTWFTPQPIVTDVSGGARGSLQKLNDLRFADQFPGANATAKLNAAIADIGSGSGVVVATPALGAGEPTSLRNDIGLLDLRQTHDFMGWESDPDRPALILLEHHLGALTVKPLQGTVTLTNGSTAVTGVGTNFVAAFTDRLGRSIKLDSDPSTAWAPVATVIDDTHLTLQFGYPGAGGTGPASYFITQLGLVINTMVEGGTPNTGSGGESVGLTAASWRTGGTRGVWGGNFNVGYDTSDPKASAVALELDLSNNSSVDAVPGVNVEEALRIITAGPKKAASGIGIHKTASGAPFVRGMWLNNSYSSQGIHINGPSNHLYLVPNTDNSSPMVVGRNAADSATKWSITNDGAATFAGAVYGGPASPSFASAISQDSIAMAAHAMGVVNPTAKAYALLGTHEDSSLGVQVGTAGVGVGRNTSGTKPLIEGVEGDAYHDAAGNVTMLAGVGGFAEMDGNGTVSKMASLYAQTNARSAGTVTSNYGLYVDAQTAGTNNYAVYTVGTAPAQFGGPVISGLNIVSFSSTPTFDAKLGNTQKITLTGNVTSSTLANATTGEQINFIICQDGTGNRTFVWPTNVKGGMTIGSTASKCSAQNFIFDGTNAYALSSGATNM